jgi:ABC-type transporter Mla maintaining outer membrane lipid asymmetry ATPase subunit MlaF
VTPSAVLEISGLTKDYRGLRPLRVQQLAVNADETVALLGFDQTSAEVFVNLVTGATLPDAGAVHVFGRATSSIADGDEWLAALDRFGIVTARAVLLEQLTVIQNLAMPFTLDIEPPADDVRQRAERLAEEVRLPNAVWAEPAAELDPDGLVRVRLGRALAADPVLLLLEHVSAGLADAAASTLGGDIRRLAARRRIALVALTADEGFAHAVAARVLSLEPATGRLADKQRRGRWRRLFR